MREEDVDVKVGDLEGDLENDLEDLRDDDEDVGEEDAGEVDVGEVLRLRGVDVSEFFRRLYSWICGWHIFIDFSHRD